MGLSYTGLMAWDRTNGFNPPLGWSLDGTAYLERQNADDFAAAAGFVLRLPVCWLKRSVGAIRAMPAYLCWAASRPC
jgi:hypothetical protein